jgi:hypothetical protein
MAAAGSGRAGMRELTMRVLAPGHFPDPAFEIISRGQRPAWYTKESEHSGSFRPWQDRGPSRDAGGHCAG